jgi:hypothetical protein
MLNQGKSAAYTLPEPKDKENQKIYILTNEKRKKTLP